MVVVGLRPTGVVASYGSVVTTQPSGSSWLLKLHVRCDPKSLNSQETAAVHILLP